MNPAKRALPVLGLALCLLVGPAATALFTADPGTETFAGLLVLLDAGEHVSRFVLTCDGGAMAATTDLRLEPGSEAAARALWDLPRRGSLRIADWPAIAVVLVESRTTAAGRQVIAVTDRPISVFGHWTGRTAEYPLGAVVLTLGPDGTGEGTLLPDATVSLADGRLVVTNAGSPAVPLAKVAASR